MLIIADRKIPPAAAEKLADFGEVLFLETHGITYEAISGHPDIFFCLVNDTLVTAPNVPAGILDKITGSGIRTAPGELPVGSKYPETARYNAVFSGPYLLHNFRYTDSAITRLA